MAEQRKNILLADDDDGILDVLTIMLESDGYNVNTTLIGEEVLEIKGELPDLILLDISMAGVDGRDICRVLKNQDFTRHIPIILISANPDTEEIAREAGADDFISKPFDMDFLLQKVAQHSN